MEKIIITALLLILVVASIIGLNKKEKEYTMQDCIASNGDTLWTIVKRYAPDEKEVKEAE